MSKLNGIFFIIASFLFTLAGFEGGTFGLVFCGPLFFIMGIINLVVKKKKSPLFFWKNSSRLS